MSCVRRAPWCYSARPGAAHAINCARLPYRVPIAACPLLGSTRLLGDAVSACADPRFTCVGNDHASAVGDGIEHETLRVEALADEERARAERGGPGSRGTGSQHREHEIGTREQVAARHADGSEIERECEAAPA